MAHRIDSRTCESTGQLCNVTPIPLRVPDYHHVVDFANLSAVLRSPDHRDLVGFRGNAARGHPLILRHAWLTGRWITGFMGVIFVVLCLLDWMT